MQDTNGNYVSSSIPVSGEIDWTDTLGRVALKIITNSTTVQYQFLDSNGAYQTATLYLQSYNIKTNFACGVTDYTGTASLPYELDIPTPRAAH